MLFCTITRTDHSIIKTYPFCSFSETKALVVGKTFIVRSLRCSFNSLQIPIFYISPDHKNPNLLCISQPGKNLIRFTELKNLNRSENPLQTLTVTNSTTILPKDTTVRNLLRIRNFLKRRLI